MNSLLKNYQDAKHGVIEILTAEIEKKVEIKLINQILQTHKALGYEEVLKGIQNIKIQLTN